MDSPVLSAIKFIAREVIDAYPDNDRVWAICIDYPKILNHYVILKGNFIPYRDTLALFGIEVDDNNRLWYKDIIVQFRSVL